MRYSGCSTTSRAGTPTAIAPAGTASRTTAPAPTIGAVADRDAVEHLRAGANPGAVADARCRPSGGCCSITGESVAGSRDRRRSGSVGGDQRVPRRSSRRLAENTSQLNPMLAPSASVDVAVLARQDRVAADEHAAADANARVGRRPSRRAGSCRRSRRCRRCGSCADAAGRRSGRRRRCGRSCRAASG